MPSTPQPTTSQPLTKLQQAVIDSSHDGEMSTADLVETLGRSNEGIVRVVRALAKLGYVAIRDQRKRRNVAGRYRTTLKFVLTEEGLASHAPPPEWKGAATS